MFKVTRKRGKRGVAILLSHLLKGGLKMAIEQGRVKDISKTDMEPFLVKKKKEAEERDAAAKKDKG